MKRLWSVVALATLVSCGGEEDITGPPEEVTFAPALGVDLSQMTRTASGLYIQDLTEGSGTEATSGTSVTVHYEGWFPNGEKFDSSRDRNQPFVFELGASLVIPGWDEGIAGMQVGGLRKLVIPPQLAYGSSGFGSIPGNMTLVFDVELLSVE